MSPCVFEAVYACTVQAKRSLSEKVSSLSGWLAGWLAGSLAGSLSHGGARGSLTELSLLLSLSLSFSHSLSLSRSLSPSCPVYPLLCLLFHHNKKTIQLGQGNHAPFPPSPTLSLTPLALPPPPPASQCPFNQPKLGYRTRGLQCSMPSILHRSPLPTSPPPPPPTPCLSLPTGYPVG